MNSDAALSLPKYRITGMIKLAESVPDIEIGILETGHLIGVEDAETVNTLVCGFYGM